AMAAAVMLFCFYVVVALAGFLAYADPLASEAQRSLIAPQPIHLFDEGALRPYVNPLVGKRDPQTFKRVYEPDPTQRVPISFFVRGFDYKLLGLIPWDRHLIGVEAEGLNAENSIFLLGTDVQGRDQWSRLMYGTQVSLLVGLVSVAISVC